MIYSKPFINLNMATQPIINDKLDKTALTTGELSDEYKLMIDQMIEKEDNGEAEYISLKNIKARFLKH